MQMDHIQNHICQSGPYILFSLFDQLIYTMLDGVDFIKDLTKLIITFNIQNL